MNRIKKLRKEKNITQIRLSIELEVSQETISAYEKGKYYPSAAMLIKLRDIFGVSVDYIIGNTDIRTPVEKFLKDGLTSNEIELLDIFKELDNEKQQKALGILFALKYYEK